VAGLELRQRVRSTRWVVVLALWFVLLLGLTLLIRYAVQQTIVPVGGDIAPDPLQVAQARERAGATLFGLVVFLVLSLGALVAPALSATSVNGDRAAGVLATLQTTLLSPAEIAVGKLLASWTTALALLATAAPFLLWSYLDGGTPAGRLLTTVVVLALTLLVVCAIGLGWSSVAARTASSTVLTYLTVVFLGLGLPLLFLLALPVARQADQVTVRTTVSEAAEPGTEAESEEQLTRCVTEVQELERFHTERVWWLLAPSPYVVVSDAAPRPAIGGFGIDDPLSVIRDGVREARLGPAASEDYCGSEAELITRERARQAERNALPATWPYGLAADLVIGGLFTVVAVRRLRTPTRSLPRGTRVA
jgi:ABC-type transport system involved in multi-copper enzyme maturation permease subunit